MWKDGARFNKEVVVTLPSGTKVFYINLTDEKDLVVSSEHEEIPSM